MEALKLNESNAPMRIVSSRKNYINHLAQNKPRTGVLFNDFMAEALNHKAKRNGQNHCRNYNALIKHVNGFCEKYDVQIFTNSVNEMFLDDFLVYLESLNLMKNYIKQLLAMAKAMAKRAGISGYAIDKTFNNVEYEGEDTDATYLSIFEIARIYYYQGLTKKQEQIRDLFIVGCLTGLRFSDFSTLTPNNFQGNYIVKVTQKTNKKVSIPCHQLVREIYDKYNGEVSKGVSIQHFNRYIKLICKKIGLTEIQYLSYTRGGKVVYEEKQKWELISSHTGRRSFATNMFLTGRMKAFEIMAITGHTTEKSFFRYIRVTQEDTVKQIAGDIFFRA